MIVVAQLRRARTFGFTAAAVLVVGTAVAVQGSASAAPARHTIAGSRAGWLGRAKPLARPAARTSIAFGLVLRMRDESGAEATLSRISDPSNASYGRWLTHAQFISRYAPDRSETHAAASWLSSRGFRVRGTLAGGMYVEASGSVARVEKTFATTMGRYRYKHRVVLANSRALSLPAGTPALVTGSVVGVLGIDQGSLIAKRTSLPGPPPGERYGVQPCSHYYGQKTATTKPSYAGAKQPYTVCGYGPVALRSAYGENSLVSHGTDGRGVTVAITDAYAAPTILHDATLYNRFYHQQGFAPGQFRQVLPSSFNVYDPADAQGWYGEETLDVEAVHAMAPGAKIVYVGGRDDLSGLDEAWAQTIDDHRADIITDSWTYGPELHGVIGLAAVRFYYQFGLEAALTGISVNFSSGDDGDETSGGANLKDKAVEFPADDPFVTGVGGSSIFIDRNGHRLAEYGWQNAYSQLSGSGKSWKAPVYSSGGGGGTSHIFGQPDYQSGVVPTSISREYNGKLMRSVPDIAMESDPNTGMRVGETQKFSGGTYWSQYRIGGTSLGSPLLAGALALADQKAGHALGFVNPLYYKIRDSNGIYDTVAPRPATYQVRTDYTNFADIAEGKHFELQHVDTQTSTLKDVPGYDDETGVGTPNDPAFVTELAAQHP